LDAFIVTPGFEPALAAELADQWQVRAAHVPGVVIADRRAPGSTVDTGAATPARDLTFARQCLPDARELHAPSVQSLAEAAYAAIEAGIDAAEAPFMLHTFPSPAVPADDFADLPADELDLPDDARRGPAARKIAGRRVAVPNPAAAAPGLGSRVALVGRQLLDLLKARRRRAFRHYLAPDASAGLGDACPPSARLIQLLALDRERLLVSAAAPRALPLGGTDLSPWPAGDAPVTVDRAPPSRAYLKLEEAFHWLGAEPQAGQACVDLGGAPGGWAYTALRRGARVTAVDRAPLAAPAAGHRLLTAHLGNAFTFEPSAPVDWLLCDVICEPARTVALIARWLDQRWCRRLVVTVKFKGRDGYGVLAQILPLFSAAGWRFARIKHLAHNKNEVTVLARER
jgi:hypothetical protein